jgi:diaminohydroxyphosphoribosylaminopyrimidine deaminase/5-amino-6-(5-phosphoribosylamino)uracil reductase
MNQDERWMTEALKLARKGGRRTSPNPLVGALVVRSRRLISQGYHAYFGGPHAEAVALGKAGVQARGATLYVTLEPCSSWGKTPPCVDSVIASRVRRVVIGSPDPNPQNHQRGIRRLKRAGIAVRVGVLAKEVEDENRAFFKTQRTGYPYVTLKMVQSLDGKIATQTGESRWISSETSRRFVRRLRDEADAVLVGKNTALLDNPRLQGTRNGNKPWRVVLDSDSSLPQEARVFEGEQLTLIAVSEKKLRSHSKNSHKGNKIFIPVPEKRGELELKTLLRQLASLGANHLLVEGGGELAWSLIQEDLVDRLVWIVAPKIIGGRGAKTSVEGEGVEGLREAFSLKWERVYRLGADWVFEACLRES